jgi:hypothetical protein
MAAKEEWLVPFRGREYSGHYRQNFLWRHENIYVMDNHRAALWCWLQHVDPNKDHCLFHLDRHYDTLTSRLDEWIRNLPASWKTFSVDQYLKCSYMQEGGFDGSPVKLFSWDNYLSIYLDRFGGSIGQPIFATHDDGDKPNHPCVTHVPLWDIPDNFDYWLDSDLHSRSRGKPWIVNVDLDYFFWNADRPKLMVSTAYLKTLFSKIRKKLDDKTIAVLTIATTPDENFTGGWGPSSALAEKVLKILGIEFKIPA